MGSHTAALMLVAHAPWFLRTPSETCTPIRLYWSRGAEYETARSSGRDRDDDRASQHLCSTLKPQADALIRLLLLRPMDGGHSIPELHRAVGDLCGLLSARHCPSRRDLMTGQGSGSRERKVEQSRWLRALAQVSSAAGAGTRASTTAE
eukprot:2020968-Rhodomonas_salina.4